jgi:hypothetical protein
MARRELRGELGVPRQAVVSVAVESMAAKTRRPLAQFWEEKPPRSAGGSCGIVLRVNNSAISRTMCVLKHPVLNIPSGSLTANFS